MSTRATVDTSRLRLVRTRTASSTPPGTPQDIRESPLNLGGFFLRTEDWNWIRTEEPETEDDEEEEAEEMEYGPDGEYDVQGVIEDENKFSMFAIGSQRLVSLLPVWPMYFIPEEPQDVDALHAQFCLRRRAATAMQEKKEAVGRLFFSEEAEVAQMIWGRLWGWSGVRDGE